MTFPPESAEVGTAAGSLTSDFWWCVAFRSLHAIRLVILPVSFQFSLPIIGIPEEPMIKEFTAQGPDQSLDK
jgi:hypothetical protein